MKRISKKVLINMILDQLAITEGCKIAVDGNKIYILERDDAYPKEKAYLVVSEISLDNFRIGRI